MSGKDPSASHEYKPEGYHRLANLMGPYTETAIFRRFGSLNMLSLLYMQAELMELESQFKHICRRDGMGFPNIDVSKEWREYALNFKALRKSGSKNYHDQFDKLQEIKNKLREYNQALLEAAEVTKIGKPAADDLSFLEEWLAGRKEGNNFLREAEARTWDEENKNDLISLHFTPSDEEPLFPWLSDGLFSVYHALTRRFSKRRRRPDEEHGVLVYSDATANRINKLLVTIIASLLPAAAIIALYAIKGTWRRIYVMVGFTAAFAMALAAFSSARRLEIFASTAAFAAVEVVFIGSVGP